LTNNSRSVVFITSDLNQEVGKYELPLKQLPGGRVIDAVPAGSFDPVFTYSPWDLRLWDLHRKIRDIYQDQWYFKDESEVVDGAKIWEGIVDFAQQYGDFFEPNIMMSKASSLLAEADEMEAIAKSADYREHSSMALPPRVRQYQDRATTWRSTAAGILKGRKPSLHPVTGKAPTANDWLREWADIAEAVNFLDARLETNLTEPQFGNENSLLTLKLHFYTTIDFKKFSARSRLVPMIRPECLAGWVWALIARDAVDAIRYTWCPEHEVCKREVPAFSPLRGKPVYCSSKCRARAGRKRKYKKQDED
jgi:hypothetical protein